MEENKGDNGHGLCDTPAVDTEYLVGLSTRLANFAARKKAKMESGLAVAAEQLRILMVILVKRFKEKEFHIINEGILAATSERSENGTNSCH